MTPDPFEAAQRARGELRDREIQRPHPQEPETYSSTDVCMLAGASLRQLDYWCRTGMLKPLTPARGSGSQRRYSEDDLSTVRAAVTLIRLGFMAAPALSIGTAIIRDGGAVATMRGIRITVHAEDTDDHFEAWPTPDPDRGDKGRSRNLGNPVRIAVEQAVARGETPSDTCARLDLDYQVYRRVRRAMEASA